MSKIDKVVVSGSIVLSKCAEDVLNQNGLWPDWRRWDKEQVAIDYEQSVTQYTFSILDKSKLNTLTFLNNLKTGLSVNSEELLRAVKWLDDNDLWEDFVKWYKSENADWVCPGCMCDTDDGILDYYHDHVHKDGLTREQEVQQAKLIDVINYMTNNNLWNGFIDWYFSRFPNCLVYDALFEFAEKRGWANSQYYK